MNNRLYNLGKNEQRITYLGENEQRTIQIRWEWTTDT